MFHLDVQESDGLGEETVVQYSLAVRAWMLRYILPMAGGWRDCVRGAWGSSRLLVTLQCSGPASTGFQSGAEQWLRNAILQRFILIQISITPRISVRLGHWTMSFSNTNTCIYLLNHSCWQQVGLWLSVTVQKQPCRLINSHPRGKRKEARFESLTLSTKGKTFPTKPHLGQPVFRKSLSWIATD